MPYDFTEEAELTNEELAGRMASVTTMTSAEITRLLPTKADKLALAELIAIVNGAASNNNRIASLRSRLSSLGTVLFKVLGTVIK